MYFSGQGKLYIGERDLTTGKAKALRFVGNVPELKFSLSVENLKHQESTSGARLEDFRFTKSKTVEVEFALEEFSKENLSVGMYGTTSTLSGGSVTNEVLPDDLVAGDYVRLDKTNASAIVITDSNATPATLVEDTDYRVVNAAFGTIQILNVGSFTQPFKAAYTAGATGQNVTFFTQPSKERWLRFEGLNTANDNSPVLIELYKTILDPQKEFQVISDDLLKMTLNGGVLYDSTKVADTVLGQFGRIVLL